MTSRDALPRNLRFPALVEQVEALETKVRELSERPVERPSVRTVHKSIRNFLVNELKITHGTIISSIQPLVSRAVTDLLKLHYNPFTASPGAVWVRELIRTTIVGMVEPVLQAHIRKILQTNTKISVEVLVPAVESPISVGDQKP